MFESYTRYKKLIGRGVAVCCPDGLIRKFKIVGVKAQYWVCGEKIDGIELHMPSFLEKQFEAVGRMKKEGCHYWINPSELYRNKGEAARAVASATLDDLNRKISNEQCAIDELKRETEGRAEKLDKLNKHLESITIEYSKKKWFNKENNQNEICKD